MGRARFTIGLIAIGVLAFSGCGSTGFSTGAPGPPSQSVGTRLNAALPTSIAELPFRDSNGHLRHLADFRGKLVVISDVMSLCQETCPLDTAALVQTARALDAADLGRLGSKVEFLSVTVDPERDSVAQMAAYRKLYRGPSNWLALTGKAVDVNKLWDYLGVYRKKVPETDSPPPNNWRTGKPLTYDVAHSDETFFLDAAAHERFILEGFPGVSAKGEVPTAIYRFLSKEGRSNLAHPQQGQWTARQAEGVLGWLLKKRI